MQPPRPPAHLPKGPPIWRSACAAGSLEAGGCRVARRFRGETPPSLLLAGAENLERLERLRVPPLAWEAGRVEVPLPEILAPARSTAVGPLWPSERAASSRARAPAPLSEGTPGLSTVPVGCGWVADAAAICRDLQRGVSQLRATSAPHRTSENRFSDGSGWNSGTTAADSSPLPSWLDEGRPVVCCCDGEEITRPAFRHTKHQRVSAQARNMPLGATWRGL